MMCTGAGNVATFSARPPVYFRPSALVSLVDRCSGRHSDGATFLRYAGEISGKKSGARSAGVPVAGVAYSMGRAQGSYVR